MNLTLANLVFVCRAGPVVTDLGNELSVTSDKMLWHDHSRRGGDIVCTGPFSLFVPECSCCPLTGGGSGHCGHTDCCWAAADAERLSTASTTGDSQEVRG